MTKEDKRIYDKAYGAKNKARIADYKAKYYEANKEAYRLRSEKHINDCVNDFHTLYYLPEHHYIGITNQPRTRIRGHRAKGRITEDFEVVAIFETKREALDAEFYLHNIGYFGKHKNKRI